MPLRPSPPPPPTTSLSPSRKSALYSGYVSVIFSLVVVDIETSGLFPDEVFNPGGAVAQEPQPCTAHATQPPHICNSSIARVTRSLGEWWPLSHRPYLRRKCPSSCPSSVSPNRVGSKYTVAEKVMKEVQPVGFVVLLLGSAPQHWVPYCLENKAEWLSASATPASLCRDSALGNISSVHLSKTSANP
jgi:hypothetical protein